MKKLINKFINQVKSIAAKIINWLNGIAKDKYQHFAVGVVIACIAMIVSMPLAAWWDWLPLLASIVAVIAAAIFKEQKLDPQADILDIIWTLGGGATAYTIYIAYNLM